jgi:hypothetical protein
MNLKYSKITRPIKYSLISLFGALVLACHTPEGNKQVGWDHYSQIQDTSVKKILLKAISRAGGLNKWKKLKKLTYQKHGTLFLPDGSVESANIQLHQYTFDPYFSAEITWRENNNDYRILYRSDSAQQFENGILSDKDPSQSVMSALYVIGMPFKLLDEGVKLTFLGHDTLRNGQLVDVIKASYDPINNQNHSTQEDWYYYFNRKTGDFSGALVYHPPTYAYIENITFKDDLPIRFFDHRQSFRTDAHRNIEFLRAEFYYTDYELVLAN